MRTNIELDQKIVERAMSLSGARSKRELVHRALEYLLSALERKSLLELRGKIKFASGYDYKKLRGRAA